ncbi:hypothetical protein NFI96_000012 [Prochilodus magdalenae]|nr:hypothetical protein NFI96_000012 [Prochilodus magdalenae]
MIPIGIVLKDINEVLQPVVWSMSMIDMRNEEETMLSPHSQARHELMHGQYTRLKEEESHWQDDLARWKSRRRSVSQDLIKKEEERKSMERLLNKEDYSQRRKSIKTYREIVEDKERRERDLHEAYLRAKTPEEAAAVLERYAQRFTISEVILERLKLPKLLERSVSADPTRLSPSPTTPDPFTSSSSPLQYLRQQSLPTPKFTATVEARVIGYGRGQEDVSRSSRASRLERSAPLLAPKPYSHVRAASAEARSAKWDEMERVNGETDDDRSAREEKAQEAERESEREEDSSPLLFYPSPSQNLDSNSTEHPTSESQPSDKHTAAHTAAHTPQPECVERADPETAGQCGMLPDAQSQEEEETQKEQTPSRPTFLPTQLPVEEEKLPQTRTISPPVTEEEPRTKALPESERSPEELTSETAISTVISQNGTLPTTQETQMPSHRDSSAKEVSEPPLESPQTTPYQPEAATEDQSYPKPVCGSQAIGKLQSSTLPDSLFTVQKFRELNNSAQLTPLSSNPKLRWDFFTSSEPAEKQQGNEKYRREQEKLKQEWERAQKEVEEEERRYHEEEQKILEETVAPLTPHSPMPHSPCWQETTHLTSNPKQHSIVRSLADWERKQEEMEKQALSRDELVSQPNGQREGMEEESPHRLQESQNVSLSSKPHQQQQSSESWKKTASLDCTKNTQSAPGGRRRDCHNVNVFNRKERKKKGREKRYSLG